MAHPDSDLVEQFRQYISTFLEGPNVDALIETIVDQQEKMEDLSVAVTDQLTISTASEIYLDKRLADKGISRPPELGMSDLAFRKMGIQITAQKQLTELIHTILETFYGEQAVRAHVTNTVAGPYNLEDGQELIFELEDGEPMVLTFKDTDFININQATAQEVASVITRFIRVQNKLGFAQKVTDLDTLEDSVKIFGGAKGPYSTVRVTGGEAQTILRFPNVRGTELSTNDTGWEITRTRGSTLRFRWVGNSKPALELIFPDDNVLIYGQAFKDLELQGTFKVTNVRPPLAGPDLDAGWFEITNDEFTGLRSVQEGTTPPPNAPPIEYSYTVVQAEFEDLVFLNPYKALPNKQSRYALAWEPSDSLLRIYMPATTSIVARGLEGATHLHNLYEDGNLDGAYGTTVSQTGSTVEISTNVSDDSDRAIPAGYGSGQSFVAAFSELQTASFRMYAAGAISGSVTCELWSDNGQGKPLALLATSASLAATSISTDSSAGGNSTFTFPANTRLSKGVRYFAVLNISSAAGDYFLKVTEPSVFNEGNLSESVDSVTWVTPSAGNIDADMTIVAAALEVENPVQVVSSKSVSYRQLGYDNSAVGGTLSWGGNDYEVDYIRREQFRTVVVLKEDHGLPTFIDEFGRVTTEEVIDITAGFMATDDPVLKFPSPYVADLEAPYTVRSEFVTSRAKVFAGQTITTLDVDGSLPNEPGELLFDLNDSTQEGPIKYLGVQSANAANVVNIVSISQNGFNITITTDDLHGAVPNSSVVISGTTLFDGTYLVNNVPNPTTLVAISPTAQVANEVGVGTVSVVVDNVRSTVLLDPSNEFLFDHEIGASLTLMSSRNAYEPARDGTDYPFYVTGVAEGRVFAGEVIEKITALGINLEILIVYPDDTGLGNAGGSAGDEVPVSEKVIVWGV